MYGVLLNIGIADTTLRFLNQYEAREWWDRRGPSSAVGCGPAKAGRLGYLLVSGIPSELGGVLASVLC